MKSKPRKLLKTSLCFLISLCMTLSVIVTGTPTASANVIVDAVVEKAVDQLLEDGMRLCCEGIDWLGEATGNEDVQKAFSFIEEWCFESSTDIAIDELKELCQEIIAKLDEIEIEMNQSFALISSVLAKDEVKTAKARVDTKWTNSVDNVIRNHQATNALITYRTYLTDAVNRADTHTLQADKDALITAFSGMYTGDIPVEMNTPEKLKELMFEKGTVNTNFTNLISDLSAGLNYDSMTTGSVALYAAQFAYQAYPFSHQQYQYLHTVMEKQIMNIILVEMMYNEYLYQQGEYLKEKFGENSSHYQGYLGYQTTFHELMTNGDTCVNALIARMLEKKMEVDGLGNVRLSLSDYMKPEDAGRVALTVNNYKSQIDFKQEVKDNKVMTNKIRDGSNISKSRYSASTLYFNRVMTHTKSGNFVYYILDPSQYADPHEALALRNLDHVVDIRLDADIHAQSCDYENFIQDMSDGVNTFHIISDNEMKNFAPLFETNFFSLTGSTVNGYLGGTEAYLPDIGSGSDNRFSNLFFLTSNYRRTKWAPAITAYTQYKALDGSKLFTGGTVSIKNGWEEDVIDTGSGDFKNHSSDYGYSLLLANKGNTFKKNVTCSVFRNASADIKITAASGSSVTSGQTMQTESGKTLDIAINGRGVVPDSLSLYNKETKESITIASRSNFENMTPDDNGFYHISYSMPYSDTEFVLYMPGDAHKVSIGEVTNASASLDKTKNLTEKNCRRDETVYVYFRCQEGYLPSDLMVVDSKGKREGYLYYHSEYKENDTSVYVFSFEMNYTHDVFVTGRFEPGITISMDTSKFIYDSNHYLKAYIQLEDYNTKTFYDEPIVVSNINNTVYGRYIFDDDYLPAHMKVVGLSSGTVFYDKDVSNKSSGDTFMLINQFSNTTFTPFGEDIIVIPTFVPNDPLVTLDDFINCSASFEQGTDNTSKRFKSGDTVTFYLRAPADCNQIDLSAVDNDGTECAITSVGSPVQDSAELVYTYQFTMPSSNVIVCGEAYKGREKHRAEIGAFTGGRASFSPDSDTYLASFEEMTFPSFYVRAPKNYGFSELHVTDSSGKEVTVQKAAENAFDGDEIIYTIGFQMPKSDVTITGTLVEGLTARTDQSAFVPGDDGEPAAYIELQELATKEYRRDSVTIPTYVNAIQGRFVYHEDYYPTHLKVVGEQTGTVFYDKDRDPTDTDFICMTPDLTAFGENIIVIPTFEKKSDPEPEINLIGISSYEELVQFAENVRDDYAKYGQASVWLEKYIVAPKDSTWSTPIGSADQPFNGTFDGRGFAIAGLNIHDENVGGLFGTIGSDGVVKDLAVAKVTFNKKAQVAGGIAAYNYGLIDHCISGVNSDFKKIGITSREYNSAVYGTVSGGIAGYNYGTIKGSRSCAYVLGTDAAGIACINHGTIYGCANNGGLGKTSVEVVRVGGLAVENHGSITACYNSAKEIGGTRTVLSALCVSNNGTIKDCYYSTFGNLFTPFSSNKEEGTLNIVEKSISQMLTASFADEMNRVSDDTVSWKHLEYQNKLINQGFPVVKGRFIEAVSLVNNDNLKVSAFMHKSMNVRYMAMDTRSEVYASFDAASGTGTLTSVYDVSATDASRNEIPAELWCEGVTVSVPVSSENVQIITLNDQGETVAFTPDTIENGWATFSLSEPAAFAVVENENTVPLPDKPHNGNVSTGDSTLPVTWSCSLILVSLLAVLVTRKRKERR